MKLLFENWRKYLDETVKPALDKNQIEYIITDKFSFNSGQSSQHRWGRGQPIIDYDFNMPPEERIYIASIPIAGPTDSWKDINSHEGEDLETFLGRVQDIFSQGETHETPI